MPYNEEDVGKALLKAKLISPVFLEEARCLCKKSKKSLPEFLVQKGILTQEQIAQAMELCYRVPYVDLKEHPVDPQALCLVPYHVAWEHQVLPMRLEDKLLTVAMADPEDVMAVDYLQNLTGRKIRVVFSDPKAIHEAIQYYYKSENKPKTGMVFTPQAPEPVGPYRQGVFFEKLLFISGQIGLDAQGHLPPTVKEQAYQALENLKAILEKGGSNLNMVLKTTVFLVNIEDYPVVNEVYAEYFQTSLPARSAVAVKALPRGALVEIEAIAYTEAYTK
jgi:2-iminobutanoate/2-iminopropanoate deaminase